MDEGGRRWMRVGEGGRRLVRVEGGGEGGRRWIIPRV